MALLRLLVAKFMAKKFDNAFVTNISWTEVASEPPSASIRLFLFLFLFLHRFASFET